MMVKLEPKDYERSRWSGGTTTQLMIWPPGGSYQSRTFEFRISSATIEDEKSEFTVLPGIYRRLSLLEGSLELFIDDGKCCQIKSLLPFELVSFWGDWKVESAGKVRDFNLMLKNRAGTLEGIYLQKKEVIVSLPGCFFIFVESGEVLVERLDGKEETQKLSPQESMYEIDQVRRTYLITPEYHAKLMLVRVEDVK